MANQFVFPKWVALEALRLLVNQLEVTQHFNKAYQEEFEKPFPVGTSVSVKLPQRFTIRDGLGYNAQAINRQVTTINVGQPFGVDFEWDSFERAIYMERSKEEITKEYIEPAVAQIAQEIDSRAAQFAYQNTNHIVGALGTDPTTTTTFMQALQRLRELGCPKSGDKGMCIAPQIYTSLAPSLQALFNPASEISRLFKEGSLGQLWGAEWYACNSLWRHTAGTQAGALTVNGANQSGTGLAINCTANDTFNPGDVISIANVNDVNPMTRRALSLTNKQFVVTAPFVGVGGGNAADVLQISPAINGPGSQYQNVDALPANNATITAFPGTTSPSGKSGVQSLLLHPLAFAIVGVPLEVPKAVEVGVQERDPETGIAIRFVRQFDAVRSVMVNRWDCLIGFGQLYADNCAVRILGA